jgi:hypothetical protein
MAPNEPARAAHQSSFIIHSWLEFLFILLTFLHKINNRQKDGTVVGDLFHSSHGNAASSRTMSRNQGQESAFGTAVPKADACLTLPK